MLDQVGLAVTPSRHLLSLLVAMESTHRAPTSNAEDLEGALGSPCDSLCSFPVGQTGVGQPVGYKPSDSPLETNLPPPPEIASSDAFGSNIRIDALQLPASKTTRRSKSQLTIGDSFSDSDNDRQIRLSRISTFIKGDPPSGYQLGRSAGSDARLDKLQRPGGISAFSANNRYLGPGMLGRPASSHMTIPEISLSAGHALQRSHLTKSPSTISPSTSLSPLGSLRVVPHVGSAPPLVPESPRYTSRRLNSGHNSLISLATTERSYSIKRHNSISRNVFDEYSEGKGTNMLKKKDSGISCENESYSEETDDTDTDNDESEDWSEEELAEEAKFTRWHEVQALPIQDPVTGKEVGGIESFWSPDNKYFKFYVDQANKQISAHKYQWCA